MRLKLNFATMLAITIAIILMQISGVHIVNAAEIEYSVAGGSILFDSTTGTITEYKGTLTKVDIPGKINGVKVTSIGELAFAGCSRLVDISIPDSVTSIGVFAFSGCSSLLSINIPNKVINIGDNAFNECSSLTSITIPNSVMSIGNDALWLCDGLKSIEVQENNSYYKSIDGVLFSKDMKTLYKFPAKKVVNEFRIPEGIECLKEGAFAGCRGLESINIPSSVTSIEEMTFFNSELKSIEVATDNSEYKTMDGILFSKNMSTLYKFPPKKYVSEYKIPKSVINIERDAFKNSVALSNINIPESVVNIGDYAFMGCDGLASMSVDKHNPKYKSKDGILFSKDETTLYKFPAKKNISNYEIPKCVTSIGYYAFEDCSRLTNISIPNSITAIEEGTFEDCIGLTGINIPNSVTEIGEYAFYCCSGLTDISIPNSVEFIDSEAFNGCSKLKSVSIQNGTTNISNNAFCGCSRLTEISIPRSVDYISDTAFLDCPNLKIYGFSPSYAETYAKSTGIKFIKIPEVKPTVPENFSVSISKNKAVLSWKPVTGATSYKVYYKKQNGKYIAITTKDTKLEISKLSKSTKYLFKVAAINSAGEGKSTAELTKMTSK